MSDIAPELNGLTALIASAFPKKCMNCGRTYSSPDDFLRQTHDIPSAKSCLKEAVEDDGNSIVEVFRNCVCGSTLMDEFSNRRDTSERGLARRQKFDRVLQQLTDKGMQTELARSELIKMLHGKKSHAIEEFLGPRK
jgi:hypothetical protein